MSEDEASRSVPIAVRGIMVEGQRLATAMSDAPRSFLARAPLVVLPAAGYRWEDYRPVLEHFAPERRVFAFDWPGFGGSAKPEPASFAYTSAHFADILAGWLDTAGIARAVLLGHGIGGAAAVRYAAARPQRVAGMCLVAPSGFAPRGPLVALASKALGAPWFLRRIEPRLTSFSLGPTTERTRAIVAGRRDQSEGADEGARLVAYAALLRGAGSSDEEITALAKTVTTPTMVVRGALDPIFSAGDAHRAAESFGEHGALEVTLPGSGHVPFLQAEARFMAAVRGLLETAEANAAVNN